MRATVKKYWFLIGLILVFAATLMDPTARLAALGQLLKRHHGPDGVIFLVFFFSGMLLEPRQVRAGLSNVSGTASALVLIFGIAPALAAIIGLLPIDTGILVGIFLVSVMPTTLSSGVVMTGSAGGNTAHALLITILANICCVFTIPLTLPVLLDLTHISQAVAFDRLAVMQKIGLYVLVPLGLGIGVNYLAANMISGAKNKIHIINQVLILGIVWMGIAQARPVLYNDSVGIPSILGLTVLFHAIMLGLALFTCRTFGFGRGRREAVIFMGSQKTLPLSVILQVTMFGQYGQALLVCVLHHLISLLTDGFLVGRFRTDRDAGLTRSRNSADRPLNRA